MSGKNLTPSLEDYLEAILRLERKNRVARVKDIAGLLNVQMPSVTGALKNLRTRELVNYEKNSYISLTEAGIKLAKEVEQKHKFLATFLEEILLLPPDRAQAEACEIEHVVSPDTTERLKRLTVFLKERFSGQGDYDAEKWKAVILSPPGE
jgi:DtxR family transcriptional regulator, Mn-dependent transcriptional regulator